MIGAQGLLANGECALVQRLGVAAAVLLVVEDREVDQHGCDVGMFGAQTPFVDGDGPPLQRFGFGHLPLVFEAHRHVRQRSCHGCRI